MKLTEIADKIKDSIFGDQSLSPSTINKFIWTQLGTLVLSPLDDKVYTNKFLDSSLVYDGTDFNDDLEFPSASYIKNTFEYNYFNKVALKQDFTISASKSPVIELLTLDTISNDINGRLLMDIDITLNKSGKNWKYKLEVVYNDLKGETTREKTIRLIPRKLDTDIQRSDLYLSTETNPQFYDTESLSDTGTNIQIELPSVIGDTYTISATIEDFIFDDNKVGAYLLAKEIDVTEDFKLSFTEQDWEGAESEDNLGNEDKLVPEFEIYVMDEQTADMLGQFIVMTTNFTGDEAQVAQEQIIAYRTFNIDIKAFPQTLFEFIPEEFKKDGNGFGNSAKSKYSTRSIKDGLRVRRY